MSTARLKAADGLRALALILIIVYHLQPDFLPGAYLGVQIFFVLAGFFSLQQQIQRQDGLKAAYLRRFTRLYRLLLPYLALLTLWTRWLQPEVFLKLRPALIPALSGWTNIYQQLSSHSYFQAAAHFDPTTHLWALAVEMQFYLLFPLLFRLINRFSSDPARQRRFRLLSWLLIALASGFYLALRYRGGDPSSLYYDSPARFGAFFWGCAARELLGERETEEVLHPRLAALTLSASFLLLLAALPLRFFSYESAFVYRYGLSLYALLAALCLTLLQRLPQAPLTRFLSLDPWQFLARRSYALYLWQFSLQILVQRAFAHSPLPYPFQLLIQLLALLFLTELSWQYCEKARLPRLALVGSLGLLPLACTAMIYALPQPQAERLSLDEASISAKLAAQEEEQAARLEQRRRQQAGLQTNTPAYESRPLQDIRHPQGGRPATPTELKQTTPSAQTSSPSANSPGTAGSKQTGKQSLQETTKPGESGSAPTSPPSENKAAETEIGAATQETTNAGQDSTASPPPPRAAQDNFGLDTDELSTLAAHSLSMIGDSVLAMSTDRLYGILPGLYVDAKVSRQFYEAPALTAALAEQGLLGDTVVIALGTNGNVTADGLAAIRNNVGERPLIFINLSVPRNYEAGNNQLIADFVAQNANTYLVDWHSASKQHPEYFYEDGYHPTPAAAAIYDALLLDVLLKIWR